MDNKGFGIPELFAFAIFIVVVIYCAYSFMATVLGTYVKPKSIPNYVNEYREYYRNGTLVVNSNSNVKNTNDSYLSYEALLSKKTDLYVKKFYSNLDVNDVLYVQLNTLKSNGFLNDTNKFDNCEGYTVVLNTGSAVSYDSYVKCPGYITSGYTEK